MHIVSSALTFHANCPLRGDDLHEMGQPISWDKNKENIIKFSSVELAQRMVKVKMTYGFLNMFTAAKQWYFVFIIVRVRLG